MVTVFVICSCLSNHDNYDAFTIGKLCFESIHSKNQSQMVVRLRKATLKYNTTTKKEELMTAWSLRLHPKCLMATEVRTHFQLTQTLKTGQTASCVMNMIIDTSRILLLQIQNNKKCVDKLTRIQVCCALFFHTVDLNMSFLHKILLDATVILSANNITHLVCINLRISPCKMTNLIWSFTRYL